MHLRHTPHAAFKDALKMTQLNGKKLVWFSEMGFKLIIAHLGQDNLLPPSRLCLRSCVRVTLGIDGVGDSAEIRHPGSKVKL
jgi:hypothetical protein